MSQKHRVKGWWLICLMAGCVAPPLCATEAISRAVEVPPPQGWTPDTPLFHDEGAMLVRDEVPAPTLSPKSSRSPRSPEAVSGVEPKRIAGQAKLGKRTVTAQQKASRAEETGGRHAKASGARPSRTPAEGRVLTRTTQAKQAAQGERVARTTGGKASVPRPGTHVAAGTSQPKALITKRLRAQQHRRPHQAEQVHASTAQVTSDRSAKASAKVRTRTGTEASKKLSSRVQARTANGRASTGATRVPVKVASSARRAQLDARTSAKRAHPGAVKKG